MNFAYQTLFYLISLFLVASAAKAAAPDRIELHAESGDHHHSDDRRDRVSFDADFVFKIPGEIILEEGKPGDLEGKLTFKVAGNKSVECEYELTENHRNKKHRHHGDSAIPWAPTAIEIIPLEHCSRGYHAGTLVTTRSLSLKLEQEGDHHHSKFAAISVVLINERPNGPQLVTVPSLAGTDQIAAVAALSAVGLVPGTTTLINSSNIAKDLLISQQPLAGVQIAKGAAVNLVFSLGPVMVSVPSLAGMDETTANAALTALGLIAGPISLSYSGNISKGFLIYQYPLSGSQIALGSAISMVFSLGPEMIIAPSLAGMNPAIASATLTILGLTPGTINYSNSSSIARDLLIGQEPLAGVLVAKGTSIDLVFSLGPLMVFVPSLAGLDQENAILALTLQGLVPGTIAYANSTSVSKDTLISQESLPGAQIAVGSAVNMVFSLGPVMVSVPSLAGMNQIVASAVLAVRGLSTRTIIFSNSNVIGEGLLIAQQPQAGAQAVQGSAIDLEFSLGPIKIAVPVLSGLSQGAAQAEILAKGLVVGHIVFTNTSSAPNGTVMDQLPAAGQQVLVGSSVDITIAKAPLLAGGDEIVDVPEIQSEETFEQCRQSNLPTTDQGGEDAHTQFYDAFNFIFTGVRPLQIGVTPGVISRDGMAVFWGRLRRANDSAIVGAKIEVKDHPEYGYTVSGVCGDYYLAIEGGGDYTLKYSGVGLIKSLRKNSSITHEMTRLDDVILKPFDPIVTSLDLPALTKTTVAQGSTIIDQDGERTARLFFPPGIAATVTNQDGSEQVLEQINVRVTEVTVGTDGIKSMTAPMPTTTAYTYAANFSIDEAPDAKQIKFTRDIPIYVDNFLHLSPGTIVPVGYYNEAKTIWEAMPNGAVITIVGFTNQMADIDLSGDGVAEDNSLLLAALGMDEQERRALFDNFQTEGLPKQYWRMMTSHFSLLDFNFIPAPVANVNLPEPRITNDRDPTKKTKQCGSIIECENRGLGEEIAIAGTSSSLVYRSSRMDGASYQNSITIEAIADDRSVTGDRPVGDSAKIQINIAGRQIMTEKFYNDADKKFTFDWDGKDAFGRKVNGSQPIKITTTYQYPSYYTTYRYVGPAFYSGFRSLDRSIWNGPNSDDYIAERILARDTVPVSRYVNKVLGQLSPIGQGFGGWTLSKNNYTEPSSGNMHFGNGETRTQAFSPMGIVKYRDYPDRLPDSDLSEPRSPSVAHIGPDGRLYWLTAVDRSKNVGQGRSVYWTLYSIDAIDREGVLEHILGDNGFAPDRGFRDDGTGEIGTTINFDCVPNDFSFGPDNAIYYADCPEGSASALIRKFDLKSRKVETVVGNIHADFSDSQNPLLIEGGQAKSVGISWAGASLDLAVDAAGTIYFSALNIIWKVSSTGIVERVAGAITNGSPELTDGAAARDISLPDLSEYQYSGQSYGFGQSLGLQLDSQGAIYFQTKNQIFKIDSQGKIYRVAGSLSSEDARDGQSALDTKLFIRKFNINKKNEIYVDDFDATSTNSRLRLILPNGRLTTIAGSLDPMAPIPKIGAAAHAVSWASLKLTSFDDRGRPIILLDDRDNASYTLIAINRASETLSPDGREMYVYDNFGTHLKTVDTLTGADLLVFAYDSNHRLIAMTDNFGNKTQITRDPVTGLASEIIAPFGQVTRLAYDSSLLLTEITNPNGNSNVITYHTDNSGDENGLLATFRSPNGNTSRYTFDSSGRLETAADPQGFTKSLTSTYSIDGSQQIKFVSAMGKVTQYDNKVYPYNQIQDHITTYPNGTTSTSSSTPGVQESTMNSDGSKTESIFSADPRFGIQFPFAGSTVITPNNSLKYRVTIAKSGTGLQQVGDPTFATLTTMTQINADPNRIYQNVTDAHQQTMTSTSPAGFQSVTHYNLQSQVTASQVSGLHPQRFEYDDKGRLLNSYWGPEGCIASSPDCRVTAYNYIPSGQPGAGLLGSLTSAEGTQAAFTRDALGQITKMVADPSGLNLSTNMSYDADGNVISISPAGKLAHDFEFDRRDLNSGYNPPDVLGGGTADFSQYEYDGDRFLTRELLPNGSAPLSVQYQYDAGGALLAKNTAEGSVSFSYDPLTKKLSNIAAANGSVIKLTYDGSQLSRENFRLPFSSADYQLGITYDDEVRIGALEIGGVNIDYRYDYDGFLKGTDDLIVLRNSQNGRLAGSEFSTGTNKVETSYQYNGFGEILRSTSSLNGNVLVDVSFGYDKLSRITSRQETRFGGSSENLGYSYDGVGRLISVVGDSPDVFSYDANGNRLNNGAIYDEQDRLLTAGDYSYFYTARGSLSERRPNNGGNSTFYNYSTEGELLSVTLADGKVVKYESDGLGRRISRSYNGETLGFIYKDQLEPIADVNGDGTVKSVYVYAEKGHVPSYMIRGTEKFAFISDERGSVRMVLAMSSGVVVQELRYDAWGRVLMDSNPGFQPFGYAGGIYDEVTGLVRFGARDYEAGIGRWLSKDPVLFKGGTNLYLYVGNDSINKFDLTGLTEEDVKNALIIASQEIEGFDQNVKITYSDLLPYVGIGGIGTPGGGIILSAEYKAEMPSILLYRILYTILHEAQHTVDPWSTVITNNFDDHHKNIHGLAEKIALRRWEQYQDMCGRGK